MTEREVADELEIDKTFSSTSQHSRKNAVTGTTGGSCFTTPKKAVVREPTTPDRAEEGHGGVATTRGSMSNRAQYPNSKGEKGYGYPGYPHSKNGSQKIELEPGTYIQMKTCRGKVQYCVIKCSTFVQCCLAVLIMMCIGVMLIVAAIGISRYSDVNDPWLDLPPPPSAYFDDYSISSSNEYCNELLRTIVQEDQLQFVAFGLVMDFCLSVAEPQASGLGGDSVTVYMNAKTNKCMQISAVGVDTAVSGTSEDLVSLKKILLKHMSVNVKTAERGPWSTRPPGHLLFPMAIHQLIRSQGDVNVANRTLNYMQRLLDFEFIHSLSISQRLDYAFAPEIFNNMHVYRTVPDLFDDFNSGKEEGATFEPSPEAVKIVRSRIFNDLEVDRLRAMNGVRDDIYEDMIQNYVQAFTNANLDPQHTMHQSGYFMSQFKKMLEPNVSLVSEGELLKVGDVTICSPRPGYNHYKSFVAHILNNIRKSSRNNVSRVEAYADISREFFAFQQKLTKFVSENVTYDYGFLWMLHLMYDRRSDETRKTKRLAGNYFVIVKHRTGEALASTSTIGSDFGSHTGHKGIVQNNFNKDLLSFELRKQAGPFLYNMEPLIVVEPKTKTIRMAYAGLPGHPSLSLDMPRKLTALTMSLFYNRTSLEQALTMPLIFTKDGYNISYSEGVPWQHMMRIKDTLGYNNENHKFRKGTTKLADEAAAVDGGRAIQFMGRGGQIMPNGF